MHCQYAQDMSVARFCPRTRHYQKEQAGASAHSWLQPFSVRILLTLHSAVSSNITPAIDGSNEDFLAPLDEAVEHQIGTGIRPCVLEERFVGRMCLGWPVAEIMRDGIYEQEMVLDV